MDHLEKPLRFLKHPNLRLKPAHGPSSVVLKMSVRKN